MKYLFPISLICLLSLSNCKSLVDQLNKGPNQYVLLPYAFKSDGSNEVKDDLFLTDAQDTSVNYGMAFTPMKNGKVYMLEYKLPPPPEGVTDILLYLYDRDENKILFSQTFTYTGTAFTGLDLTASKREISVTANKRYLIGFSILLDNNRINGFDKVFVNTFIIGRKNQQPIMPFTQGDIQVTTFMKKYGRQPGIADTPITDVNTLYGLLDLGFYSTP